MEMMEDYENVPFILPDGRLNTLPCPERNTAILLRHGLQQNNCKQILEGNILVLPSKYLCPFSYHTGVMHLTRVTISVHHFAATWQSDESKKKHKAEARVNRRIEYLRKIKNFPRIILRIALGDNGYETLKQKFKGRT